MIDPISEALRAASAHSPWAAPLVFAAGACTSAGPCVAPRFVAAAGIAGTKAGHKSAALLTAFIAGLTGAYASFGVAASLVTRAMHFSTAIYAVLALALGCAGLTSLLREERPCHARDEQHASIGASLLIGAGLAFVVSPCCTPLIAGILAYTSAVGDPLYGGALMGCFAFGHTLPVLGIGAGSHRLSAILSRAKLRPAASTCASTLMLALAAYYAVLA